MNRAQELKSLLAHPGWKHIDELVMNSQAMKFNEISARLASSEDILKGVGYIDAYRKLLGWIQSASQEDSSV